MKLSRAVLALAVLAPSIGPDEGQWLPQQVLAMDWAELQARGLQLSKEKFWHPEEGGVLSAAVQVGGCSAAFVSGDGLVVTNHHCGFAAVQALSTVERNLLAEGFVAATAPDELPAPGMTVYVVRRIRDVTAAVQAAQAGAADDVARWRATQRAIAELVREGEREPNTVCHVAAFLEGESYHLYYRTRIDDVRLAYAPPRSIGEYGGEVDNWEWPRHTGDFCFLRAYVAPDGTPRPYDPANVPYHPKHWLEVSRDGVHEGDLVLIMGYPGRTERYLTSVALADRQTVTFPLRHRLLSQVMGVLDQVAARDAAKDLAYASLRKGLANAQKNAAGMIQGLSRNATVARKLEEEAQFARWVEQSAERGEKYGSVLAEVMALDADERATLQKDAVLGLLGPAGLVPLLATLTEAAAAVLQAEDGAAPLPEAWQVRLASDAPGRDLDDVQRPILAILLDEARRLPPGQRLTGTEGLTAAPDEGTTRDWVEAMLAATEMLDAGKRAALFAAGRDAVAASKDPLVALARGLAAEQRARADRDEARRGRRLVAGRRWIEAQEAWRGKTFYPDANSTLRVSIASIKGYSPRDGTLHTPHTTVGGILDKETGEAPFASPKALLAAARQRGSSRFVDAKLGDVPVCFLSDGDTTGGNSGSPVIDGRGRLVGLNFDRVFEAVAGDYGWRAERSRNVSVDMRYVLWLMESVLPAARLLAELGV